MGTLLTNVVSGRAMVVGTVVVSGVWLPSLLWVVVSPASPLEPREVVLVSNGLGRSALREIEAEIGIAGP